MFRRSEKVLDIVEVGDPVLRKVARRLSPEEITAEATASLVRAMRTTMRRAPGVGLAAPQVGRGIALAVVEDTEELVSRTDSALVRLQERRVVPFQVLINPELEVDDEEEVEFYEGCLSLGNFRMLVRRHRSVWVRAADENGEVREIHATGWHARILQHEIDHLNGVLCIDRMTGRSLTTLANYTKHWSHLTSEEVRQALRAR